LEKAKELGALFDQFEQPTDKIIADFMITDRLIYINVFDTAKDNASLIRIDYDRDTAKAMMME